mgnify:CR=1 FL=1
MARPYPFVRDAMKAPDGVLESFSRLGDLIIFERPSLGHDNKELILTRIGASVLASEIKAYRPKDAAMLLRGAKAAMRSP